jgi:two-component system sensor histidine kinase UhpB
MLDRLERRTGPGSARGTGGAALLESLDRERGRLARELHAGAGQPLSGIKLNLDLLDRCAESLPAEGREALARLHRLAESALGQVRSLSHRLHPPLWQNLGIADALRALVDESGVAQTCETVMDIAPLDREPPHAVRIALYRCAQECISNLVRHSGATRFELRLYLRGSGIELSVSDNGRGISKAPGTSCGIGIQAVREHAGALGGAVRADSSGQGTTITICVPFFED